ncbi:hypothetical protein CK223_28690 [Mesorhizobium loti]|nr:hypothetical protein CK223_28690 [Mesorhizobium loti]QIA25447.1 hypothetical protein A9K68_029765 [Mesorhizobium sp. AA22]
MVTDPTGSRPHIGSLLLGYYTDDGRLLYAGRAGTGITVAELKRLARRLAPLQTARMPLDVPPPRESRFGSPLELSRVHWSGLKWWSRSPISPGRKTISCVRSRTKASARTSRPGRWCAPRPIPDRHRAPFVSSHPTCSTCGVPGGRALISDFADTEWSSQSAHADSVLRFCKSFGERTALALRRGAAMARW